MTQSFFAQPLTATVGQPLRVAAYARIGQGIREGVFPVGAALPRETELAEGLGVSRTVVREALMLLEEDGLISTRRGVGRFVTASAPRVGLEELRPFEVALAAPEEPVDVRPAEMVMQPNTDFVAGHLRLDMAANRWFRESVLHREGHPIAIVQEHLPAGRYLSDMSAPLADALNELAGRPATLLAGILQLRALAVSAGTCQLTPGVVGASRGRQLSLAAGDPVLILTQVVETGGDPLYLAKCIVSSRVGHLSVVQSASA